MRGHVDAEPLALYAEGQLSRRRTARVRAHLSGCPECAATVAALAEVTTQLSRVPAAPVPAPVAARLDAALSAESARRAAAATPAPAGGPPRRNPLWSPGALRVLAATGVTLVVAGGIGYAVSQSGGSESAGTSSARSPARAAPAHRSAVAAPNLAPGTHAIRPNTPSGPRYLRSGTDYQPGTLGQQAARTVAESQVTGQPLSALPPAVHRCVSSVAHHVSLVDLARYQGHPATVVVQAGATGQPGSVTVVSPHCARLAAATLPAAPPPGAG